MIFVWFDFGSFLSCWGFACFDLLSCFGREYEVGLVERCGGSRKSWGKGKHMFKIYFMKN